MPLKRPSRSARELDQLSDFEASRCLRSAPRPPRDDGQIGTSVGSAGVLHDVECRDRTAKTPQLQVSEILQPRYCFDRASDTAADQDLPVLRLGAQPCGEVAYRADRGVAGAFGKADLAQGRVALCDAGAKAKFAAVAAPSSNQLARLFAHRYRHLDRAFGGIGARHRIVEEHHDPIPRELVERPLASFAVPA